MSTAHPRHMFVRTEDIVNGNLRRLFPVINVDKVADIPNDYPGAMGVPITYMDKHNPNQFKMLGIRGHLHMENGRKPYQRIIIRNLKPQMPEVVDLVELFGAMGIAVIAEPASKMNGDKNAIPCYRAKR